MYICSEFLQVAQMVSGLFDNGNFYCFDVHRKTIGSIPFPYGFHFPFRYLTYFKIHLDCTTVGKLISTFQAIVKICEFQQIFCPRR